MRDSFKIGPEEHNNTSRSHRKERDEIAYMSRPFAAHRISLYTHEQ